MTADGAAADDLMARIDSITVGGKAAQRSADQKPGTFTFISPTLTAGDQPVRLLDAKGSEIATGQLRYVASAASASNIPVGADADSAQAVENLARRREMTRLDNLAESSLYYIFVALMFAAVLGPFVLAIYRNMKPGIEGDKRPLGLPVGSFRSILAYSLVTYLGFYVLASVLSLSRFIPPDFLLGIVATVVGFYFGSRSGEDAEGTAGRAGTIRGVVNRAGTPARGAVVRFKRTEDGTVPYSRICDVDGRFELVGMRPGKYTVQASLTAGAPSDDQDVNVIAGSDHEIEISLKGPATAAAPSTGVVLGSVSTKEGQPAAGAVVLLLQSGSERSRRSADVAGKYRFEDVTPGDYEIQATLANSAPSDKIKIAVAAGGQRTVDVTFK